MTKDIETALRAAAETLPSGAAPDFAEALSARAAEEGLLDVAYATVDSPLGPLVVAATPSGLVRLAYTESHPEQELLEDLAARLSPRILEAPARLDGVRRELDEYFEGRRVEFDLPIDWSLSRGFTGKVLRQTARIGFGTTSTYAEVASGAG
ncbi:MAG: methylated-DNA-[protein]-cysteine S-methyltransferase, partial [Thermoleophilaceae bacterium]|nr:methylated-DNA-[protein]-cysteine S-methyltransferase [Thermoleophilaceae bacterium]